MLRQRTRSEESSEKKQFYGEFGKVISGVTSMLEQRECDTPTRKELSNERAKLQLAELRAKRLKLEQENDAATAAAAADTMASLASAPPPKTSGGSSRRTSLESRRSSAGNCSEDDSDDSFESELYDK